MALHPEFPASPYEELDPQVRWFPAAEELRENYAKLLPPLVANIREEVNEWRTSGYVGASPTSKALLDWWFKTDHLVENADGSESAFRYYFAQREAVETVIWLYDVRGVRDRHDLIRFDASGAVSANMFDEAWPRFVVKMATGAGKTKVLSLLMAWSYFHKLYEPGSTLSRNFLLIAPNIIVLDRLRTDFDGLRIFFGDPVLPDNGNAGQNWRDDFQIALHIQDDVRVVRPTGNIFLTNIHRVYLGEITEPSLDDEDLTDYFLSPFGDRPAGKTTDSHIDLGEIVREIDELAVFNDEAHHIHNDKLAWFKSIQDIHHKLLQKDLQLALQIDVTATPRHNNGAIFVQTVSDYPLVEAIAQNVVKHPVLPDAASRAKLHEHQSPIITEKYADYLRLGVEEWRKSYAEHEKLGKKAVLFVMVDDTRNCDEVGEYLAKICPELQDGVLVIHTKQNGEIAEAATGKKKEELELLRRQSNEIDGWKSPYKAIVSVLMLKEGWDVRNVTVIVGLRAYSAQSNILPEQTLGRGLRRMYFGSDARETVSVMGTPAFMEFVESIQSEGVTFERVPMGPGEPRGPDALMIEVDNENPVKDIEALDIALPKLSRRFTREFIDLAELDPSTFGNARLPLKAFTPEQTREIVFKRMLDDEIDHTMDLGGEANADHRSVVAFFARQLLKEMRLVGGYDQLYPKVRMFLRDHLFDRSVDLDDPVVLRNLSEPAATKIVFDYFRQGINALTLHDKGSSRVEGHIRLRETRPFRAEQRRFVQSTKSVFNKTVGEANADGLELAFAAFLEGAKDVAAYGKNYAQVGFRIDYVKANGELSTYTPDFFVRDAEGRVFIVETKGREELDLPQKMARLKLWCEDANAAAGEERVSGAFQTIERDAHGSIVVYLPKGADKDDVRRVRTRLVIGADGARSQVARQNIKGAERMPCVFAYHEIIKSPLQGASGFDGRRCDVYYQGELSPDFYAWVFPHGETASVGVGSANKGFSLRTAVTRLREASGLSACETVRTEGAPIPLKPLGRWDNGRDVVLAGDAAGVVAPASGEGIYYAMVGGRLAAEAAAAFLRTGEASALAHARRSFMREHGKVFWILGVMQHFWYRSDKRRERFVKMCADPDVQHLTWQAYMNKELVRAKPGAHLRIFMKDMGHLLGVSPS